MDLRSSSPYWLLRHGLLNTFPSLAVDLSTDVVVIGGGISGALVAWELHRRGVKTIVVDRRHIGTGSTAASTSLLQYEIDIPLCSLAQKVGQKNAEAAYLLCRDAIYMLEDICNKLGDPSLLVRRPSFQFASHASHLAPLQHEYDMRRDIGISLQWLDEPDIFRMFGFSKKGGLLSADGATADAYATTHSLLAHCRSKGMPVFANTEITTIDYSTRGVTLGTSGGCEIRCRNIVIACGYESQRYIPKKIQEMNSTFAIISEPIERETVWHRDALIWETAEPYLYLRRTNDQRIIIGGKDTDTSNPRLRDEMLRTKQAALEKSFRKLFPLINFKTDYSWAGSFANTKDGLPYIGKIKSRPRTYFALGLGGNGITFSVIAASIIADDLMGVRNRSAKIFAFDR